MLNIKDLSTSIVVAGLPPDKSSLLIKGLSYVYVDVSLMFGSCDTDNYNYTWKIDELLNILLSGFYQIFWWSGIYFELMKLFCIEIMLTLNWWLVYKVVYFSWY